MNFKSLLPALLAGCLTQLIAAEAQPPACDSLSVRDFGALGDGETDDTAAFQKGS